MCIYTIVLEDSVYIGKYYDSFSDLLKQLNIEDAEKNRKTRFAKCWLEIADLADYNFFSFINQISTATIEVKQDETPSWFNEDDALERTKDAFKKWCDNHVFVDQEIDELQSGFYYLKNCKVECLSGDVEIEKCEDCQIDIMLEKACIWRCLNTQIYEMFDEAELINTYGCTVRNMYDKSKVSSEYVKIVGDFRKKEGE